MKKFLILLPILLVVLVIFSVSTVSAKVIEGKNPFNLASSQYGPGQIIEGQLNISLQNESNDFIKATISSKQFKMLLSDFLNAQPETVEFTCNPASCQSYYNETSSSKSVALDFAEMGSRLIGLNIQKFKPECEISIFSLSFNMTGSGNPLPSIDVGNDGITEWEYLEPSDTFAGLETNYDITSDNRTNTLTLGWGFCEKIKFVPSSKFRFKAKATTAENLTIGVYDSSWESIGECYAAPNEKCELVFTNRDVQDYYVCVSADGGEIYSYSGPGNKNKGFIYKIGEKSATLLNRDLPIDAESAGYKAFDYTLEFNEINIPDIFSAAQAYIEKCPLNSTSCVIPINISSGFAGSLTLDSLVLKHTCWSDLNIFSQITEEKAKINMNLTTLQISPLNASTEYGKYGASSIKISIGRYSASQPFEIAKVPIISSINPPTAIAGAYTNFSVTAYSPKNNTITRYEWDFGDGSPDSSDVPSISHKYVSIGNFTLIVKAIDSEGLSGIGTFKITTAEPLIVIQQSLRSKKAAIGNFSKQLSALPLWYKDLFTSKFSVPELNTIITNYEEEFETATDLVAFKEELDSFVVPEKIEDTLFVQESIPIIRAEDINPLYVEKIGGGTYNSELANETKTAIKSWQANAGIRISGTVRTVKKNIGEEDIATVITIKLAPSEKLNNVFLIIQLPSGVSFNKTRFSSSYGQKDLSGAIGIEFNELISQEINLAMPGKQDINLLTAYASPSLDSLTIITAEETKCGNKACDAGENSENCPSDCPPITKAIIWIVLIVLGAAAGVWAIWKFYAIIYEKMQETKLFKNKADLVSITTFIVNAKMKGTEEKEIREKLEKAGWNSEQIEFAFIKVKKRRKEIEKKIKETIKAMKKEKTEKTAEASSTSS